METAAVSRTERATTCSTGVRTTQRGGGAVRPRDGFRPTSPHHPAGRRIEPPPSLACAIGTRPAATAALDPPLEPPGVRRGSPLTSQTGFAHRFEKTLCAKLPNP
jgi:hypothetical protein